MKKLWKALLGCLFALVMVSFFVPFEHCQKAFADEGESIEMVDSGLNYVESTENFVNPERGFYQALSKTIPIEGQEVWWSEATFAAFTKNYGIIHLRFGLENFSFAAGGQDADISEDALISLSKTLDELRRAGGTAIVRFSYNLNGEMKNGEYLANEPEMSLVERHIEQLGEVLAENTDVIAGVETGMLGPWGEQHSTPLASSGEETYFRLVEAWLKVIPVTRTVSVRRPLYYIYWANRKYGKNLTQDELADDIAVEGTDSYRIGVYNDGYLGSSSDLGTFKNRVEETKWLSGQAEHTLYGGEVVADDETGLLGDYNNREYLEKEAFVTHTSYLNISWNDRVISAWKNSIYDGSDLRYRGKTDYDYIATHLGYRLVLRKSELSVRNNPGGILGVSGKVENVGFGNIINNKDLQILLISDSEKYVADVDWDVRKIRSKSISDYHWRLRLPSSISPGKYTVYLRIRDAEEKTDSNLRSIRFANEGIFDGKLGANKLGEITVSSDKIFGGYEAFEQIDGGIKRVSVSFSLNGGRGPVPETAFIKRDRYMLLPECEAALEGHSFSGWSDGENVYSAGESYRVLQETEFFAVWSAETYTVRFLSRETAELAEGSAAQEVEYGKAASPPVYVREGYRLVGWEGEYRRVTGHTVCYAVWEKIPERGCGSCSSLPFGMFLAAGVGVFLRKRQK